MSPLRLSLVLLLLAAAPACFSGPSGEEGATDAATSADASPGVDASLAVDAGDLSPDAAMPPDAGCVWEGHDAFCLGQCGRIAGKDRCGVDRLEDCGCSGATPVCDTITHKCYAPACGDGTRDSERLGHLNCKLPGTPG